MSEYLSTRHVQKTQRKHRCVWCPEEIPVGSVAVRYVATFDGDFFSSYFHPECWEAQAKFYSEEPYEDGFYPHSFKRGTTEEA